MDKLQLERLSKILREYLQVEVDLDFGKNSTYAGIEIQVKVTTKFNGEVISNSVASLTL